jgi:predicted dehydrogenase
MLGIDTNPQRVALAASLGLSACLRDQAVDSAQAFTANRGFDVVLICADTSSNDPVELAAVIARDRARLVATGAVGLTFTRKIYYGRDYPLGYVRWTEGRNFKAVVDLMADGRLKVAPLISHRFPIEKAADAYEVIIGKKKQAFLGVLLTYPQDEPSVPVSRITFPSAHYTGQHGKVKLGVLGAGLFANATLLPAIKKIPDIELVGIASAGGLHAQHSGKIFGFAYATSNDDEILNDPNINTVAILTRHNLHADLVVKALQAGKHVFTEKPLAIDESELEKVIAALTIDHEPQTETHGPSSIASPLGIVHGLLTVGFNRRFAPLAVELSKSLVGRHEPMYMHYRVNAGTIPLNHWTHDPAQGGGRIIGEGCHFVDFLAFLVGAAPVSVSAHTLPDNGKYHEDNISMTFTFPDGSIGVVDYLANGDKSYPKERVEVFCGGRVAVLDDYRGLEMVYDGQRTKIKKAQDKGWYGEWVAFTRAIRDGSEPPIP